MNLSVRKTCMTAATIGLLLMLVYGCAKPPTTYTMPPDEVESFRASINKVAIVFAKYKSIAHIDLPAKGVLPAAGRGFVSGAGTTIAAGVVSPVPGGTIIGVILSPIGGIVGSVHGMITAEPSDKVEAVEAALYEAGDRLDSMNLRERFKEDLLRLGNEETDLDFVYMGETGPVSAEDVPVYRAEDLAGADTVLEVRPLRAGLWGLWTVNPPSSPFVEIRVRLIRVSNGKVILDDVIMCAGEERAYDEWAADNGNLFVKEILKTIPRLTEKVIDDTFRVYALSKRRG